MNNGLPDWIRELQEVCKERRIGGKMIFFPELDSTNRLAHDQALAGEGEGLAVLADRQWEGKGRLGRVWQSPPGVNLYASIILRPPIDPAKAPQMTLLAGIAAARAISVASGLDARIKWPNDIFIRGKKAAGILAEMKTRGSQVQFVILGIGINVNLTEEAIPEALQETATSLRAEAGKDFSRARVAEAFFREFEEVYGRFLREGFSLDLREDWNRLSWVNRKWATIIEMDQACEGLVLGLDTDGALLLEGRDGKTRRCIAGDVSLRLGG